MRQILVIASNIIIVIAIAFGVINYANGQHLSSAESAEQAFLNSVEVVGGIADNYLLDTQTICNGWANYINANDMNMEEAVKYLRETRAVEAISAHVIWTDTLQGMSTTEKLSEPGDYTVDYSDHLKSIFDDVSANAGISITARYTDPMTGDYVLSFCRRVRLLTEEGMDKDAVLLCLVPISYLEEKWVFPSDYTGADVALIKKDGEYILKPNAMKNESFYSYIYYYNRGVIDQDALEEKVQNERNGHFYAKNAAGEDCIWAFRSLKKEENWSIVVSISRDAIQGTPTDWFIAGIILLGLAAILFIDIGYFMLLIHINKKTQKQLEVQAVELQTALRSERENKSIVRGISREYDAFWLVRLPDMGITLIQENESGKSRGFKEAVKRYDTYPEIMRCYVNEYIYEDDREYFREMCDYENVKKQIQLHNVFSISYRRLINGKIEYYQLSYAATDTETAVIMGFRDVNEMMKEKQKQADDLAEALAAAEYANRAKTAFLSSMSHDIRTPMNAIIGFTNLAAANVGDQQKVTDYLSKISLSGEYLLSLINDVLDMSRIESGKVSLEEKELHLPDLFHDLMAIIQANVNAKNLRIYADTVGVYHEDIVADRLRLNQILLNIVGNAIKPELFMRI